MARYYARPKAGTGNFFFDFDAANDTDGQTVAQQLSTLFQITIAIYSDSSLPGAPLSIKTPAAQGGALGTSASGVSLRGTGPGV